MSLAAGAAAEHRFELGRLPADAALLFTRPAALFAGLERAGPWWPPVRALLFWGLAGGAADAALSLAGLRSAADSRLESLLTLAVAPPFFVFLGGLLAALFHGLCRALGGRAGWPASFRVLAAAAPLLALDVAIGPVLLLRVPLTAYKFFLAGVAAVRVHELPRRRAQAAFGALLAASLLFSLLDL